MPVSKRLRYEILRRDSHTCRYCGASAPDAPLRVDHVVPQALGGTDTPDNLVTSCEPCNSGKSSATVDSAVVADVADDALRWAAAMEQAADDLRVQDEPKRAYRSTFQSAWNEWTFEHAGQRKAFELPDGWKTSLDNFRNAGLPHEVWPDIIEKAMTNRTVKPENLFRYCCGIGWRMVTQLQATAKRIVGAADSKTAPDLGLLANAVLYVWEKSWAEEHDETPAQGTRDAFVASLADLRERCEGEPARMIEAARMGVWFQGDTLGEAIRALEADERSNVVMEWADAWRASCSDWPNSDLYSRVSAQVDAVTGDGPVPSRLKRAAVIAGSLLSSEIHHGLAAEDLEKTQVLQWHEHAVDIWARAFSATATRWPSDDERSALRDHLKQISRDGSYLIYDVFAAVAAAGAYQDADPTTCLPRKLSVFEAAASPLSTT